MSNVNFDSQVITRISLKNCSSTLADNLITSHQVDYLSAVLIPAEAVEYDQKQIIAIKYNNTLLV